MPARSELASPEGGAPGWGRDPRDDDEGRPISGPLEKMVAQAARADEPVGRSYSHSTCRLINVCTVTTGMNSSA